MNSQLIAKVVGGIIVWNGTETELEQCGCESGLHLFLQRDPRALAIGRPSAVLLTVAIPTWTHAKFSSMS